MADPVRGLLTTKVGKIEATWKADKLTCVTSLAQEERQRQPRGGAGTSMDFDDRGVGTLRQQKTNFYIQMPDDKTSLENRFDVMDSNLQMLKARFPQNSMLATIETTTMKEYCTWLCEEKVWGFCVKGPNQVPESSPT